MTVFASAAPEKFLSILLTNLLCLRENNSSALECIFFKYTITLKSEITFLPTTTCCSKFYLKFFCVLKDFFFKFTSTGKCHFYFRLCLSSPREKDLTDKHSLSHFPPTVFVDKHHHHIIYWLDLILLDWNKCSFLCTGLRETEKKSPFYLFPLTMQNNSSFHTENISPSDPTSDQSITFWYSSWERLQYVQ